MTREQKTTQRRQGCESESITMPDPRDVSVSKLLSHMVCVLVDRPEFVVIKMYAAKEEELRHRCPHG